LPHPSGECAKTRKVLSAFEKWSLTGCQLQDLG
jgi:hypothetical protein